MKTRRAWLVFPLIGFGMASLCGGCLTTKNPNATTPPTVALKVKGDDGQYAAATTTTMSAASPSLDLMCIVSDAAGVKSIDMQFAVNGTNCNISGAQWSGGGFQLSPPLPAPLGQSLSGNGNGKVLNELPILATIHGPLSCSFDGGHPASGTGSPLGDSIVVLCQGSNWSAMQSSAQGTLTINLQ